MEADSLEKKVIERLKKKQPVFICHECGVVVDCKEEEWWGLRVWICPRCGRDALVFSYEELPIFIEFLYALIEVWSMEELLPLAREVLRMFSEKLPDFIGCIEKFSKWGKEKFIEALKYFVQRGLVDEKVLFAILL